MEQLLFDIDNNDVCQIITTRSIDSNISIELLLPKLLVDKGKRTFVCLPETFSVKLTSKYAQSIFPDIIIGYAYDKHMCYNLGTQLIFTNSEHLKYKLLRYFSVDYVNDFADVIIMFDPNMNDDYNIFNISILSYGHDNNIAVPKLAVLFLETTIPVNIIYNSFNMTNLIKLVLYEQKYQKFNIVIHVPDYNMANTIKNKIDNSKINVIFLDDTTNEDDLKSISLYESSIIIAIDVEEIPLINVNIVIDMMVKCIDKKYTLYSGIYKSTAENHIKCLGHCGAQIEPKCYRIITEKDYDKLPQENFFKLKKSNIKMLLLDFFKCNINPRDLSLESFNNYSKKEINETIKSMINLDIITKFENKYLVLPCGVFASNINLDLLNVNFLWQWLDRNYPVYPGIVIAVLLNNDYQNLILQNTEIFLDQSTMHSYLNVWNSFISSQKYNPRKIITSFHYKFCSNYKNWSRLNFINHEQICGILKRVSELYKIISNIFPTSDLTIKEFDSNFALNLAIPILSDIYKDKILIVKNNKIVQPCESSIYVINKNGNDHKNLFNGRIIALHSKNIFNKSNSKKLFYIDSFITI